MIVILESEMVDAMLEIDREISNIRGKKKYMYVHLSKAIYGTLKEALLYYRKLSKELR